MHRVKSNNLNHHLISLDPILEPLSDRKRNGNLMEEGDMEPEEREVGESVDPVAIGQIERSREKQRGREREVAGK